jgi:CBS domain containing-hemolysin-like protein
LLDDHGTAVGLAFLEEAIEEIIGPIQDEFDNEEPAVVPDGPDAFIVDGDLAMPEAIGILGLGASEEDDTIGGHVVALLKRLPEKGDQVDIGPYTVNVTEVERHRVVSLRFDRQKESPETSQR